MCIYVCTHAQMLYYKYYVHTYVCAICKYIRIHTYTHRFTTRWLEHCRPWLGPSTVWWYLPPLPPPPIPCSHTHQLGSSGQEMMLHEVCGRDGGREWGWREHTATHTSHHYHSSRSQLITYVSTHLCTYGRMAVHTYVCKYVCMLGASSCAQLCNNGSFLASKC